MITRSNSDALQVSRRFFLSAAVLVATLEVVSKQIWDLLGQKRTGAPAPVESQALRQESDDAFIARFDRTPMATLCLNLSSPRAGK